MEGVHVPSSNTVSPPLIPSNTRRCPHCCRSIFDDADSRKLVRRILEEEFGDKDTSPSQVMSAVSNLKRAGLTNRQTLLFKGSNEQYELACKVLPLYQSTLRANNAKDFEDLIGDALCLVTSGAQGMGGAAASGDSSSSSSSSDFTDLASRYRHILVDEWQDVDSSQYNLLVAMSRCASDHAAVNGAGAAGTAGAASLFVVGDSMQTIYRCVIAPSCALLTHPQCPSNALRAPTPPRYTDQLARRRPQVIGNGHSKQN